MTLTFRGPKSDEAATPNPFRDYRLNVTFRSGDTKLVVPGFFAADGQAAETGATESGTFSPCFQVAATNQDCKFRSLSIEPAAEIEGLKTRAPDMVPDGHRVFINADGDIGMAIL